MIRNSKADHVPDMGETKTEKQNQLPSLWASALQDNMISLMNMMHIPAFLLAPLSGMLLAAATASTTAGATIAAQTFSATLLEAGVPAIEAGAMINASATIIDSMPHGSFFHASAGAVGMDMKKHK